MWQLLGENASEIIALCALGLTSYQAYISRAHNRLSLKPHLTRFTHRSRQPDHGVLVFEIMNNGVGPAFINSFEILLDGKRVQNLDGALQKALGQRQSNSTVATLGDDYAMPAGEKREILILAISLSDGEDLSGIEETLKRFDLIVEYQSVYGERAKLDTRTEKPIVNQ
ncbi:hypothetical protein [Salinivibrio kushneri]|uniref:hypothetical protein n=1 Tax=Salinivibrio kushneri TaxID=1908198 RepID=UPI0010553CD7|nr:hypothetical protein [Salinivibrio kushneri]